MGHILIDQEYVIIDGNDQEKSIIGNEWLGNCKDQKYVIIGNE